MTLAVGGSGTLTATVQPSNATNKAVSWTSSNTAVARINGGGSSVAVDAVDAGQATITVTTSDGGKTATCTITVVTAVVPVTGVTLDKSSLTLAKVGDSETLVATVQPDNATNKNVTWSSSNPNVASVSNGLVTALAPGTAAITVTTQDGGKTATCSVTVPTPAADVYLAGFSTNNRAALWTNGTIGPFLSARTSRAFSVYASGDDVYVAGYENIGGNDRATYWKNREAVQLSTARSGARSILVSGNDVYVAGHEADSGDHATVWKNGTATRLNNVYNRSTYAYSVFVSGSDVYVAGCDYNTDYDAYLATIWKNGERLAPLSVTQSTAYSVYVSGANVYAAGWTGYNSPNDSTNRATVWKNGAVEWQSLNRSDAYSVFVSGSDVYVAGAEYYSSIEAVLWKNGTIQRLAPGESSGFGRSVFVNGGDVYVGGDRYDNPRLWKNGVRQTLTGDGDHYIYSVFVK
jgi:hypothetical protein